ncbi:MAG TPA: hypothetical protein VN493_08355 [Thermoanaerobaculia bacterium]|nr:hypothetical protein [Thermoanaerobaculia bacterium]
MRKTVLLVAAALLGSLPLAADEVVRSLDRQFPAAEASRIHLDFPVGEVHVEAGAVRAVGVHVELECDSMRTSRCIEAAKKIELVATSGDSLHVELKGWPKAGNRGLEAKLRVTVPRDLPLTAELGVGEMRISGMESDLDADLGVGEVSVVMAASAVSEVHVDTGVGEADLFADGRHWEGSGFIAKELSWTKGKAEVSVDCGVGEAEVRLE